MIQKVFVGQWITLAYVRTDMFVNSFVVVEAGKQSNDVQLIAVVGIDFALK